MQSIKTFAGTLAKYHFWVLSVLVVIIGLTAWLLTTSSLSAEFKKFSSGVKQRFNDMSSINSQRPHPTQEVLGELDKEIEVVQQQVSDVWKDVYSRQREEVLFWPKKLPPDFLAMIDRLNFGDEIERHYRETYQNFVKERFDELPKIVRAKIESKGNATAKQDPRNLRGARNMVEMPPEEEGIVDWAPANYKQLQAEMVWQETPPSIKLWVTQEDLWIYETLLEIIARTNIGVTARHEAVVSEILNLQVGKNAAPGTITTGRIFIQGRELGVDPFLTAKQNKLGGGGAMPSMPSLGGMPGMPGGLPGGLSKNMLGDGKTEIDPKELTKHLMTDRYLDARGKPMPPTQDPKVEEFKRVPVRLEVKMHPRRVHQLLTECANAPLPVEVHQVRVNVAQQASQKSSDNSRRRPETNNDLASGQRTLHVPVILQGIVYIFNPPNEKKLLMTGS